MCLNWNIQTWDFPSLDKISGLITGNAWNFLKYRTECIKLFYIKQGSIEWLVHVALSLSLKNPFPVSLKILEDASDPLSSSCCCRL